MKQIISKDVQNYQMNSETYALRKRVINFIYEIKKHVPNLPRVEVRVGKAIKRNLLGQAKLNKKIVWITDIALNMNDKELRNTVYHELIHAVYGIEHDEKCPLMQSCLDTVLNKEDCVKHFLKYIN